MWQEIIVEVCVLGAVIFLLRRWLPIGVKKAPSCGSGCGGCGTNNGCATGETKTNHSH